MYTVCTLYVHVYTLYVHVCTLYVHVYTQIPTEKASTPAQEEAILEERSARLDYHMDTKHMDPKKAKQAERLGMGGFRVRYIII